MTNKEKMDYMYKQMGITNQEEDKSLDDDFEKMDRRRKRREEKMRTKRIKKTKARKVVKENDF